MVGIKELFVVVVAECKITLNNEFMIKHKVRDQAKVLGWKKKIGSVSKP